MIWLIGNKGMLGTEVAALLEKSRMPHIASDKEVDIADPLQLERFAAGRRLGWIINCSAYTAVDRAEDEPELAFRVNAAGPRNIAELARARGAKLIHISTDYVFDGEKPGSYVESDEPNPLGAYGASKYKGELGISETFDRFFIVRTAWLYGKNGGNFVSTMLRLFGERDELRVVGDQFGSPTYAPDLAQAVLSIISLDSEAYGIYHFANEGRTSWHEFACEIYRMARESDLTTKRVLIRQIGTAEYPTRARRPQNSYLSKEKMKSAFNISIRPWQSGLQDYLQK